MLRQTILLVFTPLQGVATLRLAALRPRRSVEDNMVWGVQAKQKVDGSGEGDFNYRDF